MAAGTVDTHAAPPPSTTDKGAASVAASVLELHKWLQQQLLDGSWARDAARDAATADAQLLQLRRTAAALKQGNSQHGHVSLSQQQQEGPDLQACAAAVDCVQLLTEQLLQPPPDLYSDVSGAPAAPAEGLELAGEQQQMIAAAQVQLLALLLGLLPALEAPAAAAAAAADKQQAEAAHTSQSRNKPVHFQGIVEIEELPTDDSSSLSPQQQLQQRLEQQLVQVLLVVAVYAPDSSSHASGRWGGNHPSAGNNNNSSSTGSGCVGHNKHNAAATAADDAAGAAISGSSDSGSAQSLEAFCDRLTQQGLQLSTPWSGQECRQRANALLQLLSCGLAPPLQNGSSSRSDSRPEGVCGSSSKHQQGHQHTSHKEQQQQQQQQEQQQQQLLQQMLPLLLAGLRDTLLAQHRHRQREQQDMVPYSGPGTFERCLAARQLTWLVQQLQPPVLTQPHTFGLLLPLMLAVADDTSPSVRQYGHAALGWLGLHAPAGSLQWQGQLLRQEAKRLVVGCEESCWGTALPAATSLVLALEGKDPRSPTYHTLLLELLTEAERSAHKPQPRLIFMACVARLVPRLGLYLVRHLAALMPLLLEWVHAYDEGSSVVALQLLQLVVVTGWPRMGVHVGVIGRHVAQVLSQERVEQGSWWQQGQQQQQACQEEVSGAQHQQKQQEQQEGKEGARVPAAGVSRRCQAAVQLQQVLECMQGGGTPAGQ